MSDKAEQERGKRHHLDSMLMRESLLDKDLQKKTLPAFVEIRREQYMRAVSCVNAMAGIEDASTPPIGRFRFGWIVPGEDPLPRKRWQSSLNCTKNSAIRSFHLRKK